MPVKDHQRVILLGVNVSVVTIRTACRAIIDWVGQDRRAYVCVAPVSTIVDCNRDRVYRDIVNRADMVTPDGMPVVWLARSKGCKEIERTYGPDLMRALCATEGLRHYFFGGTPAVLASLEERLKKEHLGIKIVGMYSPPFRPAQVEEGDVLDRVNAARPDILWVGMGSPKQDFWMSMNRPRLDVPVMVGVGAAFDFLAGSKPQAPRWMGKIGLEWVFRLCSEPRRLWKRYLIGNSLFIFYILRDMFSKKS